MKEYICTEAVVPLRTGPSHRAEMGSQILFGERFRIVDSAGSWTKIELVFDSYSGWVDNDHFAPVEPMEATDHFTLSEEISVVLNDGSGMVLHAGSEIINLDSDGRNFQIGDTKFEAGITISDKCLDKDITTTALRFKNAPYLWGGRTICGIDCSGLTQLCYKIHGKSIPRDSFNQAEVGISVNMLSDALPGDLLFFDNDSGKITHVGILYDKDHIIHASGRVRIDPVDHQGIFRTDLKRYSHKLRIIKRI